MTEQEIIEGNKLIAEFMELKRGTTWKVWNGYANFTEYNDLKYHESWDWLMPIVENIERIDWNVNINQVCCIYDNQHKTTTSGKSISKSGATKIESVWLAVVDFIKWYNQNRS
jgi:hypothetical protein